MEVVPISPINTTARSLSPVHRNRSLSPSKLKPEDFDVDNPTGSALLKVAICASGYNKARDGIMLQGLQRTSMTTEDFREQLLRAFRLKFSDQEFDELVRFFDIDGNGLVDGAEFLVKFTQLGFFRKSESRTMQLELNRRNSEERLEEAEQKRIEAENRLEIEVETTYTEEERISALRKMAVAAAKYDKNHPSSVGLEGFDGRTMTPGVFREMLKRTFNLKLTPKELGAIIRHFDNDGNGHIDCSEFLVNFFKLGFNARSKLHSSQIELQFEANVLRKKESEMKLKLQAAKIEIGIDNDYSQADVRRALDKMLFAATKYDRNHPSSIGLEAFDGRTMSPGVFKEMLKRTFNLKLTPKELGAIINHFDSNKNGVIDCAEFIINFLKLGFNERNKTKSGHLLEDREAKLNAIKYSEERLKEINDRSTCRVDFGYSEEERISALQKMAVAAAKYDKNHPSSVGLEGFDGRTMTPGVFREMLKRTFNLKLTPKELGAIIRHFDNDGNGHIDCSEFLLHFFKLGFSARSTSRLEVISKNVETTASAKIHEETLLKEQDSLRASRLIFTKKDEDDALQVLTETAHHYAQSSSATSGLLHSFKGPTMHPESFRDLFRHVFRVKLTWAEVGALFKVFDLNGNGRIEGSEFLSVFLRLVRIEQKKMSGVPLTDSETRSLSNLSNLYAHMDESLSPSSSCPLPSSRNQASIYDRVINVESSSSSSSMLEVESHKNTSKPNIRDVGTQVTAEFGNLDPFLDEFESWKPKITRKQRGRHQDPDENLRSKSSMEITRRGSSQSVSNIDGDLPNLKRPVSKAARPSTEELKASSDMNQHVNFFFPLLFSSI